MTTAAHLHTIPQDAAHIHVAAIARSLHQNSELLSVETLDNRSINCCWNHREREKIGWRGRELKGEMHEVARV